MDLGVARVPQTVKSSGPGSDLLRHGETDQSSERSEEDGNHERREECLELLRGEVGSDESDEGDELKEPEDTWRSRKRKRKRDKSVQAAKLTDEHENDAPRAAMCSEVLRGRKPTKGTCIDARVPMRYHDE